MMRRQTSADAGPPTDAGERCSLNSSFGDHLRRCFQEGVFGLTPSFRLALSL